MCAVATSPVPATCMLTQVVAGSRQFLSGWVHCQHLILCGKRLAFKTSQCFHSLMQLTSTSAAAGGEAIASSLHLVSVGASTPAPRKCMVAGRGCKSAVSREAGCFVVEVRDQYSNRCSNRRQRSTGPDVPLCALSCCKVEGRVQDRHTPAGLKTFDYAIDISQHRPPFC